MGRRHYSAARNTRRSRSITDLRFPTGGQRGALPHRRDSGLTTARHFAREFGGDGAVHGFDFAELLEAEFHSALLQGAQNFFGRYVANHFILRKRTAAKSTKRRIEAPASRVESSQNPVRCSRPRAMQVHTNFH